MAKGPIITNEIEALIASVYQNHPKWKAPMVRNEVSHILRKNNPKLPSGWPSLSTVQKVLAPVRKKMKELPIDPRDNPWSMGTLDEYPIPAEAVAKIFELKVKGLPYLTIRTAQWISRLSSLPLSVDVLYVFAWIAAYDEKLFDVAGLPRDTDTLTFETRLLAVLQNPDKAHWTMARWENPLDEDPQLRKMTQEVLLKFYPIYIPPTLEELKETPEYERWKAGYYSKENQKILKRMRQQ